MPILVELEIDEGQRLRDLAKLEKRPAEDLCQQVRTWQRLSCPYLLPER